LDTSANSDGRNAAALKNEGRNIQQLARGRGNTGNSRSTPKKRVINQKSGRKSGGRRTGLIHGKTSRGKKRENVTERIQRVRFPRTWGVPFGK